MSGPRTRLAFAVLGDVEGNLENRLKYAPLCEALARHLDLVDVYDPSPRGARRLLAAAGAAAAHGRDWRAHYYKSVRAFRARTRRLERRLERLDGGLDAVLQHGVLFDGTRNRAGLPVFVYADYTLRLQQRTPQGHKWTAAPADASGWLALEQGALQRARHVFTRSRLARDSVVGDYGVPAERVSVVGAGVNLPALPDPVDRGGREVGEVLFIGLDFLRKGGDVVLRAFARAREAHPRARLTCVTRGPVPAGLPRDGVEVLGPAWDRDRLAELYRRADVFVLHSRLETWGDVLLEAMAFGLPCVGVAAEAMGEIVEDGRTGLLAPLEDVDAVAAALVRLLGDTELRRRLGAAGRGRVEERFSWDEVARRLASRLAEPDGSYGPPRT